MARPVSKIPTLSERDGVFYVNWYDATERRTRRRSLDTRCEQEARARYGAFIISEGERPTAANEPLVEDVIDAYLLEHGARRTQTPGRIKSALRHMKTAFGSRGVATLVEEDFEDYARDRRAGVIGSNSEDSTIIYEIGLFKAAVNHAVKRKRVDPRATPLWWMPERPKVKCDKWLSMEQIDKLIGGATSLRVENFVKIAYWTAGRYKAVLHTQADRVSLDRMEIDLHPPGWPRTKKRNPTIPILGELEPTLRGLLMFKEDSDYLLDHPGHIRKEWGETVAKAGLSELGVTPHWLRHSRATHLLQAGKRLFHVAGLLGDTTHTVERIYGHHCVNNLREHLA